MTTLREVRLDSDGNVFKINNLLDCGEPSAQPTSPFECDNPMDMQFGPDGSFYLLTYGDGFFAANPDAGMYRFEYVKGQRAPQAVLGATPTDGHGAADACSSPARARATRTRVTRSASRGTSTATARSTRSTRTRRHVYTANGVYTARLTVTDSSGKTDSRRR